MRRRERDGERERRDGERERKRQPNYQMKMAEAERVCGVHPNEREVFLWEANV